MLHELPHATEADATLILGIISLVIVPGVAYLGRRGAKRAAQRVAEAADNPHGDDSWGYYKALILTQQKALDRQGETIDRLIESSERSQQTADKAFLAAEALRAKIEAVTEKLEKLTGAVRRYLTYIWQWAQQRGETMPMPPNAADRAELAHLLPDQTLTPEEAREIRRQAHILEREERE